MDKKREVRNLMFQTEMARRRCFYPVWAELGLIAGQPRVLSQLLIKDHITQKELSEFCYVDPTTLSRALDKLESMGYVCRKENPGCRRSFLIALTEEGRLEALKVQEVFADMEEQMLGGFSEQELDVLKGMLDRVYENLK